MPTTIISDKSSTFASQVVKEVTESLGITLERATIKQAQKIGWLERTYASLRKAIKVKTGERRSMWHKYVNNAVLNYNTSHHTSIGGERCRVFSWHVRYNCFDLKRSIRPQKLSTPISELVSDFLDDCPSCMQKLDANLHQVRKPSRKTIKSFWT